MEKIEKFFIVSYKSSVNNSNIEVEDVEMQNDRTLCLPNVSGEVTMVSGEGCRLVETIVIPSEVTSVDKNIFSDFRNLKEVICEGEKPLFKVMEGVVYSNDMTHIYKVLNTAFSEVVIAKSVRTIATNAFNTPSLKNVIVEDGNAQFVMHDGCIYSTDGLLVYYPSDKKDAKVVLDHGFYDVHTSYFENTPYIKELVVNVDIEDMELMNIPNVEKVMFSDEVSMIGSCGLCGCRNLKSVALSKGMQSLINFVFNDCESLEEIDIPANIWEVRPEVFNGCTSLKRITLRCTDARAGYEGEEYGVEELENVKGVDTEACELRVPAALMEQYRDSYWNQFASILPIGE